MHHFIPNFPVYPGGGGGGGGGAPDPQKAQPYGAH